MKHFLKETDFSKDELPELFALAEKLKRERNQGNGSALAGQTWAMLFFKSSTRTRVSFEVGINELGGSSMYLSQTTTQLTRGESWADTARTLSRYVHGLIIRTFSHEIIEEFAREGSIPVINALTDFLHPCQSYSDILSMAEIWRVGDGDLLQAVEGHKIAFLGDCDSNMANSLVVAANLFGMRIALSGPREYAPDRELDKLLSEEGLDEGYHFTTDPREACEGADVVYTDVWVSMGDEADSQRRLEKMAPYSVTSSLMATAKADALFMHCLPAHPGEEVTQEVIEGPRSIVFDQAENRLHMQKAILMKLTRRLE